MSRIVLVGANGSGKTTILDTIYRLVGACGATSEAELENWVWPLKKSQSQAQIMLENYIAPLVDSGLVSFHVSTEPITKEPVIAGKEVEIRGSDIRGPVESIKNAWIEDNRLSIDPDGIHENGNILYFPSQREMQSVSAGQLTAEETPFQYAYKYQNQDKWTGSVESFLVWQNYLDLEDLAKGKSATRLKSIVSSLNDIFADKEIIGIERGRVVIGVPSGHTHGLDDLSSGEKQLVLLLTEILRRAWRGSVILIDEPEISLHSAWQRGLMTALDGIIEQYDAQVILATHSLEVATSVMPYEVISLNDLGLPLGKWEPEKEALP